MTNIFRPEMGDENLFDFESVFFGTVQDSFEEPRTTLARLDVANHSKNPLKRVRFDHLVIDKAHLKPCKRKKRKLDSGPESKQKTKADYSMLMVDGQLKRFCEVCDKLGKSSRLKLYQVNFDEAFYMCENIDCSYPLDIEENCSQSLVNRDYRNIAPASQRRIASVTKTPVSQISSSVASKNFPISNHTLVTKQPLKDTQVNVIQNKTADLSLRLPVSSKPNLNFSSQISASKFLPFEISKGKNSTAKSVASTKSAKTVDIRSKPAPVVISDIAAELLNKRRAISQTSDSSASSEGSASKRQKINNIYKEAKQVITPKDRISPISCSLVKTQTSTQSVQSGKSDSVLVKPKGKVTPQVIQQILKDVKDKAPPSSVLGASKFAPFSLTSSKPAPSQVISKPSRAKKDNSVASAVQESKSTLKSGFPNPKPKLRDNDILKAISKRVSAKKDSGPIRKIIIKTIPDKRIQNAKVQNQKKSFPIIQQILKAPPNQHNYKPPDSNPKPVEKSAFIEDKNTSENSENFNDYCDSFDVSIFDDIVDQHLRSPVPASLEPVKFASDWEGSSDGHSLNSSGNSSPKHSPYNKNSVVFDESQLDEEVSLILSPDSPSLYSPTLTRSSKKTVGSCIQKQVVKQLQNIVDKSYLRALRRSPVELDKSGKLSASISLNALGNSQDSNNLVVITDSIDNLVSSEITCEVIDSGR